MSFSFLNPTNVNRKMFYRCVSIISDKDGTELHMLNDAVMIQYDKNITIPLIVCGTGGKSDDYPLPKIKNSDDNDYNIQFLSNTLGFLCVKLFNNHMDLYFFNEKGENVEFKHTIFKK